MAEENGTYVRITLPVIYDKLVSVERKVDSVAAVDAGPRLTQLERFKSQVQGIAAFCIPLIPVLVFILTRQS
jgi:hypothetical protein